MQMACGVCVCVSSLNVVFYEKLNYYISIIYYIDM